MSSRLTVNSQTKLAQKQVILDHINKLNKFAKKLNSNNSRLRRIRSLLNHLEKKSKLVLNQIQEPHQY
mgnify:CR=1 FL=1